MCIRDSPHPAGAREHHDRRALALVGRLSGQRAAAAQRGRRCLLYTSDAADERSSVDLGGRRIIKKKKNVDVERLGMKYDHTK